MITNENTSESVVSNLIRSLIDNMSQPNQTWQLVAFVLEFGDGYRSISGYVYSSDGNSFPVYSDVTQTKDAVEKYLASYYKPDEKLPLKILVQFSLNTGEYNIEFEDTNEDRWKVKPSNYVVMREELRPYF